jgi:hypothetical protein
MNVYPESDESGAGKSIAALMGRPGLAVFCTLPQGPVRGLFAGEGRLFAVGGSHLYEITSGLPVDRSVMLGATTIGNDGRPVQAVFNGNQLGLCSAGDWYCDSGLGPVAIGFTPGYEAGAPGGGAGSSFTALTIGLGTKTLATQAALAFSPAGGDRVRISSTAAPGNYMVGTSSSYDATTGSLVVEVAQFEGTGTLASWSVILAVPAVQCAFIDDYFLVQASYNSRFFNCSALLDGSTWDPLDAAAKEGYPDNLSALFADHQEVYLLGSEGSTEVWADTGAAPPAFPFARNNAGSIHFGCWAPNSPVRLGNGVAWIAGDSANPSSRGGPVAVLAEGFLPRRVSTHAVEAAWAAYGTIADAVAYSYVENGHNFWEIHFPTADATWVYDATEQLWHQRGWWNGTGWGRERGWVHACVDVGSGQQHFVGDWENGDVYTMAPSLTLDNVTPIYWRRTAPYISDEEKRVAGHRFQLDGCPGLKCWLEFSDDYGSHWSNVKYPRASRAPAGGQRYTFSRLGGARHRLYRVTGTGGGTAVALIAAYLRAEEAPDS